MTGYRTLVLSTLIALTVPASTGFGQDAPRRTITEIADGVYRATNNNHGTVFMVTAEGIVLADPISTDFAACSRMSSTSASGSRSDTSSTATITGITPAAAASSPTRRNSSATPTCCTHLALPPASTRLTDCGGAIFAPRRLGHRRRRGDQQRSEAADMEDVRFAGFDADGDGSISGAELMRGPVSLVHPPNITYIDQIEINLGGDVCA